MFELPLVAKLWDKWFYHGEVYFIRIALAVCACLSDQLTDDGFEMVVIMLKSAGKYVSAG